MNEKKSFYLIKLFIHKTDFVILQSSQSNREH